MDKSNLAGAEKEKVSAAARLGATNMALTEIRRYYSEMFQAEKKVADYILANPGKVLDMSIAQLAKASGTSDATIIRMCRHIGFSGFYQMKISLASSMGHEAAVDCENSSRANDVVDFLDMVARSISDMAKHISRELLFTCSGLLAEADTVYTAAWGNTGQIAGDLAHRLTRSGVKSFASEIPEYSLRSIGLGTEKDVLVAISHSGASRHVIDALKLAGQVGMKRILITDQKNSEAAKQADYVLCTEVQRPAFRDFGAASHVFELIIVDALLYFMKIPPEQVRKGGDMEMLLSGYKI